MIPDAFAGVLLLSVVGFGQARPSAVRLAPIYANPAARVAYEDLTAKRRIVIQAQQELDKAAIQADGAPTATPTPAVVEAQKKLEQASAEAKEAASKVL